MRVADQMFKGGGEKKGGTRCGAACALDSSCKSRCTSLMFVRGPF